MKIKTVAILAGMLSLAVTGVTKAEQTNLVGAANDSAYAVQAGDLESARFLSGKFISGAESQATAPSAVDFSGPAGYKELPAMSISKKVALAGEVPPPSASTPAATEPAARKGDFKNPGFLKSLTEAVLSPIVTPVDGVISGGKYGSEYGKERMGKTGAVIGAILGGIVGLAVGLVVGVVKTVVNVVKAFIHLFNGRL